ncbi:MAG TPA: carboxypeptidase-like regulatory domain-containing protein, partial [Balneolales bacterium]|nr:carboxypeptidase-like regulatory domain-containing protein [Balneolales bacterium]
MKKTDTVIFKIVALTIGLILFSSGADVIAQTQNQNQDAITNYYSLYQKKIVRMDPNPNITLELNNVPLKKALKLIADQAQAGLYYNPDLLPDKRVNVSLQKMPLGEALRTVLEGTSLEATSRDRNIILHKRDNNIEPVSVKVGDVNLKTAAVQQTITGTVTDASTKEALPGVNVVVKGTTVGTATDGDGHYSLSVPDDADTLIFSYIGYQTRQVLINGRSKINVALQSQTLQGQQLVVVGYGTQQKENLTGSVSPVKSSDITSKPVAQV